MLLSLFLYFPESDADAKVATMIGVRSVSLLGDSDAFFGDAFFELRQVFFFGDVGGDSAEAPLLSECPMGLCAVISASWYHCSTGP